MAPWVRLRKGLVGMVFTLTALIFSSPQPQRLAGFWGGRLDHEVTGERGAPAQVALVLGSTCDSSSGPGEKWGPALYG